jgi:hypothetical protein
MVALLERVRDLLFDLEQQDPRVPLSKLQVEKLRELRLAIDRAIERLRSA